MNNIKIFLLISTSILLLNGCFYKLKGISISPEVNTFYVENFRNVAINAPSDLGIKFTEALRIKIRDETRLYNAEVDPDISFEGEMFDYRISAEAASGENNSAFNKLTIVIKVTYTDSKEEKNGWKQNFSFYKNFPTDQSIQDVEDQFITEIFKQITDDIFNKAFTNW